MVINRGGGTDGDSIIVQGSGLFLWYKGILARSIIGGVVAIIL